MAINPLLISGTIQRMDDMSMLKQQQDSRPVIAQQNAQSQVEQHAQQIQRQVVNADDANKTNTHVDAREKGKNEYFSRKKSGKKKSEQAEDRVVKKGTSRGFDMKV